MKSHVSPFHADGAAAIAAARSVPRSQVGDVTGAIAEAKAAMAPGSLR